MIADMNDGARVVTVAAHVTAGIDRHQTRIEAFYEPGSQDSNRLALLTRDVGDLADAYLYGTDHLYERLCAVAAGAEEWMLHMQREDAR